MLAYHGSAALKDETLATMAAHRAAEQLVQGQYWLGGKGCAVACLTHDPRGGHAQYPERWGIPEVLAHLEDRIFEGLSAEDARAWPERFLAAIPVGADLSLVWPRFAVALLTDPDRGVARLSDEGSAHRAAIERVAALYRRMIAGESVSLEEWQRARRAATAHATAAAAAAATAATATAAAYAAHAAAYAWMAGTLCKILGISPGDS